MDEGAYMMPMPNIIDIPIFFDVCIFKFQSTGIGRAIMDTSIRRLIICAAR